MRKRSKVDRKESPDLLSTRLAVRVSEAARMLGISTATVRRLIRTGDMPGRPVGSGSVATTFVIPVEGLRQWLSGSGKEESQRAGL